jgi:hypothetical protein
VIVCWHEPGGEYAEIVIPGLAPGEAAGWEPGPVAI